MHTKSLLKSVLYSFLLFFYFSFSKSVNAEAKYQIIDFDTSRYPQISVDLKVRENLLSIEKEVLITEELNTAKKVASDYNLSVHSEPFPLHVYLSIPSYANWEEKKWLMQFSHNIASLVEKSKGRFYLNVQSDDQFHFFEGIPASKLSPSFSLPKEKDPKFPLRSWEKVVNRMKNDDHANKILITVSLQTEWEDKFRIADFAKKVNQENLKVFVVSPNSLETTKLASYVNGKFFAITSEDGIGNLFQELNTASLPKVRLVYISPWNVSVWSQSNLNVNISFGEEGGVTFPYEISALNSLYLKFIDPFVFYPVLFFFIILCFSVLFYLRGFDLAKSKDSFNTKSKVPTIRKIASPTEDTERSKNEVEIYERVYGDVAEKARENEIIAKYLDREEIFGETYHTAVIVFKDGNLSGSKYPIQSEETTIGRSEECDLMLSDPYVNLIHAKIKKVRGRHLLFDCASESGVLLNGKKLLRPKALHDLDEIRIGKTIFSFRGR
ncbi:MAG: FHA domain-containing protein [Leptospira sp.]|nr:FHA domain-containing protein [Leptospira sp.]